MKGFGGVFSFSLNGEFSNVGKFLSGLNLVHLAASLGSVGSLAGPPKTTSHVETTYEERQALGIPENLIRYSCGIENFDDLRDDFQAAFNNLS